MLFLSWWGGNGDMYRYPKYHKNGKCLFYSVAL